MNKQTLILSLSAVFLLMSLSAGAYFLINFYENRSIDESSPKQAVDVPLTTSKPKPTNQNSAKSSGLQVQGVQTPTNTKDASTALPTPDQFEQHEQYNDSSTIRYVDTLLGTGEEAKNGSSAWLVYKGWLTDGTLFDETKKNEQGQLVAFNFTLGSGQVIQGWEQGIVGMKVGGKRRLIIPSSLGYGATAEGPIPANSMLIFDVELAQIQ